MKSEIKLILAAFLFVCISFVILYSSYKQDQDNHEKLIDTVIKNVVKKVKYDLDTSDKVVDDIFKIKTNLFENIHKQAIDIYKKDPTVTAKYLQKKLENILNDENIKLHFYLINKDYIIYDTTYKPDINLNMSKFTGAKENIDIANENGKIIIATPSIDIITKEYRAYSYGTVDKKNKILLEIGYFDKSISKIKQQMYKNSVRNAMVTNIELFGDYQNYIVNLTKTDNMNFKSKSEFLDHLIKQKNSKENLFINKISNTGETIFFDEKKGENIYRVVYSAVKHISISKSKYKNYIIKVVFDITDQSKQLKKSQDYFYYSILLLVAFFILFLYYLKRNIFNPLSNEIEDKNKELEKQYSFIKTLIEKAPIAIFYKDIDGKYIGNNEKFEELFGHDKDEILGKNVFDIATKELAQFYHQKDLEVFNNPELTQEYSSQVINHKTGEIKDVIFYKSAFYENGIIAGIIGAILDITELNKTQKNLKFEKNKLKAIISHIPDLVWIKDPNGVFITCNNRFEDFYGANESQITGKTDYDFTTKEIADFFRKHDLSALNSDTSLSNFEELTFASDGHKEYCYTTKTKFFDSNGEVAGVLGIARDITKIKETEDKLKELNVNLEYKVKEQVDKMADTNKKILEQSRLAQMGEMISMIAHQWRQPLGAISSSIVSIQNKLLLGKYDLSIQEDREKFERYLTDKTKSIEGYLEFLSITIDEFRNFYKKDKEKIALSTSHIINEVLKIVQTSMTNKNIQIDLDLNDNKEIKVYKNELMQVVLNILKNSEDNFLEKDQRSKIISISTKQMDDNHIISIRDNGGGIDKNILPNIFNPYFSTKEEKNGTGLGLYMSKTIIEEHHGGKLHVKNRDDGVEFYIILGDIS